MLSFHFLSFINIATSLAEIFRELDCPAAVYFDFNQLALVTISIIIVLAAGL